MRHTPVFKRIRESKAARGLALLLVTELVVQTVQPLALQALTSGPTQPEVQGFQPIGLTEMVDPFTGDFSYNIPLMEIGGYPLNLSYQSGISMDQEASWAGLGWNLHTGAITRQLRGLPDDFSGDVVTERINLKPNKTIGVNVAFDMELFGFEANSIISAIGGGGGSGSMSVGLGIEYNNYTGVSLTTTSGISLGGGSKLPMNASLNMTSGKDGLQISPNVSYSGRITKSGSSTSGKANIGLGADINSRKGLTNINLSGGVNVGSSKEIAGTFRNFNNDESKAATGTFSKGGRGGINNSSSLNLGAHTFTPSIEHAMETYSFSGRFKIGGATLSQDFGGSISAHGSVQQLVSKELKAPAYGYIHSEKANNNDQALLDYNREKDNVFSMHHKNLPLTAFTNDMFSISAQGLGGTFRAYRNDVGYVYNNRKFSPSNSGALGVEIGLGNIVDAGIDISINSVTSSSGAWRDQNNAIGAIPFRGKTKNEIKENFFLRMTGEKIPEQDPSFVNNTLKGKDAIRYNFKHKKGLPQLSVVNSFTSAQGAPVTQISTNERNTRQRRNTAVYFLTADEIRNAYPHKVKYLSAHAKGHHIAEITVVTEEGMRYVFGLAAYNTKQVERSFAVGGMMGNPGGGFANGSADNQKGLVNYSASAASVNNGMGIDNFFQETETPAYAHSWMLTEILSPDYSDLTGNGPTQDDLGAYVLFTYGVENGSGGRTADVPGYGWRTPAAGYMKAGYMEGLRTNRTDDKANVVFGTKDIWYCHSIESKTHKVLFDLESRSDACGVNEHGGVNMAQQLKRIRSISYVSAEAAPGAPPIKKVNFEYDYSLCPGAPNASSGKLTLKRIYFTYENSNNGKYSPYTFTYDTGAQGDNPSYNHGDNDRWGIMKQASDNPDNMSNTDYPYALQDKEKQARYASAWSLKQLELPSGGKIHITYESDDYAYVQDRRACNMYTIAGFAPDKNGIAVNQTFTKNGGPNDYLIVNIPDAGTTLSSDEFRRRYLWEEDVPGDLYGPLRYLYFRFLINVNRPDDPKHEYVSGYAEIDRSGDWCGMTSSTRGYIKIKRIIPAPGGDPSSPFAFAAWSFSRAQTPEYAYNQPTFEDDDAEYIIKTLASASVAKNLFDMLTGVNRRMRLEGYGSHVNVARSWVKLFDPDGIKYGAGSRVQKLEISDEWDAISGEPGRTYGQQYSYRLPNGKSSGVAAWEPGMGADENPFKKPVYSENKKLSLVMEERFYVEEPFGESFFPAPGVGYARVEVKDIVYDDNVTSKSTGKMVKEYYTARDFPTITSQTAIDPVQKRSNPIVSLLSFNSWNLMNVSQGYAVEVNDMHGKPKAERLYAEGSADPFAYTEYLYKMSGNKLDNNFAVIGRDGIQTTEEVGVEYDMVADFREQETIGHSGSLAFNLNYGMIGMFPLFSFSLFPGYKRDHTRFRSAVVSKLIQRYGLLERTISFDKGALLETRTVALDRMTGNTVVEELTNEFKDKYYKTDIPAHWAYSGMRQAGENIHFTFGTEGLTDNAWFDRQTGEIKPALYPYLEPGDEVMIKKSWIYVSSAATNNSNAYRYWVAWDDVEDKMYLINYAGAKAQFTDLFPAAAEFKVVRSGHRNQQQVPIGTVTSLENPIRYVSGNYKLVFDKELHVINTNSTEFREQWQTDLSIRKALTDTVIHDGPGDDTLMTTNIVMGYLNTLIDEGHMGGAASNSPTAYSFPSSSAYNPYFIPLVGCPPYSGGLQLQIADETVGSAPGDWPVQGIFGLQTGDHTMLSMAIPGEGLGCTWCESYMVLAWDKVSDFGAADWADIEEFETVQAMEMHTVNTVTFRFYLVLARMADNSTRKFVFADRCFRPRSFGPGTTIDLEYVTTYECMASDGIVNPYIHGILGNWRTHKTWVFQGDRNKTDPEKEEDLRHDGYIIEYKPFWTYNGTTALWNRNTAVNYTQYDNWNWTNEMTMYSPYGFDLENVNTLNIFSAAVYGFKNMLATGIASNARNKEIGFDSFEDYYQDAFDYPCQVTQFWISDKLNRLTDEDAHTGRYSMKLSESYTRLFPLYPAYEAQQTPEVPYALDANDLWRGFAPDYMADEPKEFILSFWARGNYDVTSTYDYPDIGADVISTETGSTILVAGSLRKSKIIEGWQKFEYRFIIPDQLTGDIIFRFDPGSSEALFDDIRVHPFDANMKTFVYDRTNFRYKAELDENNFATFYDYDQEGKLVRIKKETERGIMTIQETRSTTYKRETP
ncbi:MAG: hypothetical protein IBJ09_15515 [Bacteroidia bacterium]|nr:hypothetical protein [Bacteroidia bacterium]